MVGNYEFQIEEKTGELKASWFWVVAAPFDALLVGATCAQAAA